MRGVTALLAALALSACVDFEPKTGPLAHAAASCGGSSEYPTEGYPTGDAGANDAACPDATTNDSNDSGYY